jgi:outer membrane protein OmpA-like peptidoglycan-associated protein
MWMDGRYSPHEDHQTQNSGLASTGRGVMKRSKSILILWLACMLGSWAWGGAVGAAQKPSLVLHFEPGSARLSASDKADLRHFFQTYSLDARARVFVVGYTDARGGKTGNYRLSRKRAETVRREIVRTLGIDSGIVMALGKGAESPAGTNRTVQGRARNRRVEIYLANGRIRKPPREYGPGDPYLPQIQTLLRQADAAIKDRRLAEAVHQLRQAHGLGADHYAQWHVLTGIAGYYANMDPAEARAHLAAALNMEPFNAEAREYMSRVEARIRFARGDVTRTMGQTMETAIDVTAMAQQHEYLRLFEVEPLAHRPLDPQPVEMWQCEDRQGAPVVYYFNHSRAYQWAFARTATVSHPEGPSRALPKKAGADTVASAPPAVTAAGGSPPPENKKSGRIWESKIFK